MTKAYFITGTDTGVGKTLVASTLLALANQKNLRTLGLKPVAAGGVLKDGKFVNEDAWELMHLSNLHPDYSDVNPIALRSAIAPHIAASEESLSMSASSLAAHCVQQAQKSEFCVIEGAGGWSVPINESETMADIAVALGYPIILVVGMRLGCINHSLLSAQVIRQSGLGIAGWVANKIDPDMHAYQENITAIEERLEARMLGIIEWQQVPAADKCTKFLDITHLI